jgi:hypothetical protein
MWGAWAGGTGAGAALGRAEPTDLTRAPSANPPPQERVSSRRPAIR